MTRSPVCVDGWAYPNRNECEWFDDPQGARTGWVQSLTEVTLTPEFRPHPKFIIRGDLRRDHSTRPVFELSDGTFGASQVTLSVNGLFVF